MPRSVAIVLDISGSVRPEWGSIKMSTRKFVENLKAVDRFALVTFNTHDLSTYAGWRSFSDLKTKRALAIDPGETDQGRWDALGHLDDVLRRHDIDHNDFYSVVSFMARTRSPMMAVSMEDLLGIVEQPNIPGTVYEHPNWKRRLPVSIEHLASAIDIDALERATRERSHAG